MSNQNGLEEKVLSQGNASSAEVEAENDSAACKMQGTGWLKGVLPMAICCAAPLLAVGALAFFGLSMGAIASGFLRLAAILACPLGMYFMMRMVMKDKK
jgi:hypothetical protein